MTHLRSKTFFRYMLSYLLILIFPVLILLATCGRAIIERNMEEMMQQNASHLARLSDTFDEQLEQLIRVAYMIQNNSDLNPAFIGSDVTRARAATTQLMRYQSMAMTPAYLYTYRSGTDYVYTSSGRITPKKLFEEQYAYQQHTLEDFFETIDAKDSVVTWPSDAVKEFGGYAANCLTLFVSVGSGNIAPKTRTVFLIPVDALPALHTDPNASVLLLDKDGSPLLSAGSVDPALVAGLVGGQASGRLRADGEDYFVSSAISSVTGWTYVALTPAASLRAPFSGLQRTLLLGLALIGLVGGLLVYAFAVRQYRPLQHLTQKAQSIVDFGPGGTEMDKVENALEYLQSARNEYKASFDANRDNLMHEELLHLFFSEESSVDRAVQNLQKVGITLSPEAQYQIVLLFATGGDAGLERRLRAALTLPNVGFEETLLFVNYRLPNQIAVILPADAQSALLTRLEALQDALEVDGDCAISMGVSEACVPRRMREGYRQAERALDCRLVRGSHCIVFSEQQEADSGTVVYPQKELEELQWHLLQLDEEETKRDLRRLVQKLEQSSVSMGTARMIGFDVLSTVVKSLSASEGSVTMAGQIDRLASFHTIHELTGMLEELIEEACQSIRAMQAQQTDKRLVQIQAYIDEHCFNPNFSINTVSDYFELSPSNLSHYFKKSMGMSLSDYIQTRRKEEACRLLVSTSLSVQEIGERLGMMNVTSFIRSFKQQTGVTPGQYRKTHV